MTKVFNRKSQREKRKILRGNMTQEEVILWSIIKKKDLGYKFRRRYGIDRYVVDFYCPALRLVIEIDGDYHLASDMKEYDPERQKYIESAGIKFLRFSNKDVRENLKEVMKKIKIEIKKFPLLDKEGFGEVVSPPL